MRKTFTLITLAVSCFAANAQSPANNGFENWTMSTLYMDAPPYFGTGMQSFYTFGSDNAYSVPSPVQGMYAAHLETMSDGNDTIPGTLLFGIPSGNSFSNGGPYTQRPDSLVFYSNWNMMPGDTGTILVGLELMNNLIGYGVGAVWGTSGGWTRMSFPFTYFAAFNPDSICCWISSANLFNGNTGSPGSVFEIDAIQLISATAQLPNNNFETWTPAIVGEPDNWTTLNFLNIYDGNFSVTQDNTPYMGSFDVRVETTVSQFGDTIGYITNGNFTGNQGPGGGMQVMQNPQKITGYYKYIPVNNDTALAGAWSYHWNVPGDSAEVFEEQFIWLPAAANWTYFEINMTYNTWPNVDTLAIAFASSNYEGTGGIHVGSQLFLDEIDVSYYPLGITAADAAPVVVFPNPTTRFLNVRLENIEAGENTMNVYDAQGKLVKSGQIVNGGQNGFYTMDLSDLPAGTYMWEITNGTEKTSATFVKQ